MGGPNDQEVLSSLINREILIRIFRSRANKFLGKHEQEAVYPHGHQLDRDRVDISGSRGNIWAQSRQRPAIQFNSANKPGINLNRVELLRSIIFFLE
jgi:hypothetical protein